MSITTSNGHIVKRRKLSHGSTEGAQSRSEIHEDEEVASEVSDTEHHSSKPVQKTRTSSQSRRSTSIMSIGGMTKSSLMQLLVNELVEEIRPDYEHRLQEVKSFTDKVVQAIKSIPERAPLSFPEAEKILRKKHSVAIPFAGHRPASDIKYKFEFKHPERVSLRGGLPQHLCTKDDLNLDVCVQMPSELFEEKDYLNHRALHKRAYYTACLAAGIVEGFGKHIDCRYELQDGNNLVPVIAIKPVKTKHIKALLGCKLSVSVVLPEDVGPVERMTPSKNCVRMIHAGQSENTIENAPTSFYNSTVRSLASTLDLDQLLEQAAQKCDAFSDVCLLGQTWLRQRGFSGGVSMGGFGVPEWAYTCALLLTGGGHKGHPLFSERYSTVQLFKAMLQVLASRDLTDPLLIRTKELKLEKQELPFLYDGLNGMNVLAKMSRWSYNKLRHQAQLSLAAVNSRMQDNFDPSFITKVAEPSLQYDEIYTVDLATLNASAPNILQASVSNLYNVLKKGLGDRVVLLDFKESPGAAWDIDSSEPKHSKSSSTLEVCVLVNPDAIQRLIDHGPTAEQQDEARDFREFWGERSELRRFRDGSITETLVWSSGKSVILQIIQYLAAYHFKIPPSALECKTPDFLAEHLSSSAPVNAEDAFKITNNKYQELSSKLHQMEGLPLPIRSVSPAGQALRSASMDHSLDSITSAPIDLFIQFDSSARWPDHLLAIQQTKMAFLAKISDLITESDSSLSTRIGVENTDSSPAGYYNTSFLDIISPAPAAGLSLLVFRLRIHHERELQLLQNLLAVKSLPGPIRDSATTALAEHKRTFVASSIHTTSLRNLISHFQPLSSTIRLLKYWIASHNLSNHIPDPVLETIAAYTFLHPYPWSTPGNATTAFLRCLHFLSHWDWAVTPLIVDLSLSQDMTTTQTTELEIRFQAWRKLDPNMNTVAWFVGTNIDTTGTIWTQGARPARVVAGRIAALARAAVELIKSRGTDMMDEDWKNLFLSPISDFDFVIHLKSSVMRGGKKGSHKNGKVKFKNLQVQEDLDVDRISHDIVELYLSDLQKAFGNAVLFFHGDRGKCIAGLWRPNVTGHKDWRVRLGYSTVPYVGSKGDENDVASEVAGINKDGILAEMALLGEGMVEKISVRK